MPLPVAAVGQAFVVVAAVVWAVLSRASLAGNPSSDVPLVSMSTLSQSTLSKAATNLGVFRLEGHGVDIASVLDASKTFFALPETAKRSARSGDGAGGGFMRGYIPLAGESGLRQFVELKEGFCYGKDPHHDHNMLSSQGPQNATAAAAGEEARRLLVSPNAWPNATAHDAVRMSGEAWRRTLERFLDESITVTNRLGDALSIGIAGGAPDTFSSLANGGEDISLMRLFHYFAPDVAPTLAPGVPRTGSSPHTDWHLMTVVLQDTAGGLQVRRPRPPYDWIDVPAVDGELVIIIGDYLSALSHGKYVSPVHRVLLPTPPHKERFSATYFRYPHVNATLPEPAVRHAEKRAAQNAKRRRKHFGDDGGGAYMTLVKPTAEGGTGLETLASLTFGELLLDKWREVASNKVATTK